MIHRLDRQTERQREKKRERLTTFLCCLYEDVFKIDYLELENSSMLIYEESRFSLPQQQVIAYMSLSSTRIL